MGKNEGYYSLFNSTEEMDDFIDMVNELCSEVNSLDKEMGVRLKHPNIFNEPEQEFNRTLANIQDRIINLVILINRVDPDWYYREHGDDENAQFTDYSKLRFKDNVTRYYTDSLIFKSRFLSGMMTDMMYSLENITKHRYNNAPNAPVGDYETQILYLKEIFNYMKRLITVMISGNNYHYILMKNMQLSMHEKKKTKTRKLNRYIFDASELLIEGCKTQGVINPTRVEPEDVLIYTTVRLAYMLSTGNYNYRCIPKPKEFEGITLDNHHDVLTAIGCLGDGIMEEREKRKRPIIAACYEDARPKIMTNYRDANKDVGINTGMRAIGLVEFFCNDKNVSRFIERLINK